MLEREAHLPPSRQIMPGVNPVQRELLEESFRSGVFFRTLDPKKQHLVTRYFTTPLTVAQIRLKKELM